MLSTRHHSKFDGKGWPTRCPLVAILRGITPREASAHAEVLLEAGFDCIEVPTNSPQWADSVRAIASITDERTMVGAGTVLNSGHLSALLDAGGRMAVSPHTDVGLVEDALTRGLLTIPGATTTSEVLAAWRAGAHVVKLFPASQLGVAYLRAIRTVLPQDMMLLAVGGVTAENLCDFIDVGCTGAGLGSELYRPGQLPRETAARAHAFFAALNASTPGRSSSPSS